MSEQLIIHHLDNRALVRLEGTNKTMGKLRSLLSAKVPGHQFSNAFKRKVWDGKKRFLETNGKMMVGFVPRVEAWCAEHGIEVVHAGEHDPIPFDPKEIPDFLKSLNLPEDRFPRDYQLKLFIQALRYNHRTFLSATGTGKSLSIYLIARWFVDVWGLKVLIIVPNIGLVKQMISDFEEYNGAGLSHGVYGGKPKQTDKPIVVGTWQSLHNEEPEYFDQYGVLLGDECLTGDTLVTMADGSQLPISEVKIGDLVLTVNDDTNVIEPKPVIKVHHNISSHEELYLIEMYDGTTIRITGNHKVKLDDGNWIRVDQLQEGQSISTIQGVSFGGANERNPKKTLRRCE